MLFNLGAVYNQIGLSSDRSSVEGRRQASHSFMAAAGAFSVLRDNVPGDASIGSSITVDVSIDCVWMLERLMLAQAQECVYENTIAKGSSHGVCAKISRQVLKCGYKSILFCVHIITQGIVSLEKLSGSIF